MVARLSERRSESAQTRGIRVGQEIGEASCYRDCTSIGNEDKESQASL